MQSQHFVNSLVHNSNFPPNHIWAASLKRQCLSPWCLLFIVLNGPMCCQSVKHGKKAIFESVCSWEVFRDWINCRSFVLLLVCLDRWNEFFVSYCFNQRDKEEKNVLNHQDVWALFKVTVCQMFLLAETCYIIYKQLLVVYIYLYNERSFSRRTY